MPKDMTQQTLATMATLRQEINAALAPIAAKHGFPLLRAGNITYGNGTFTIKVDGQMKGALSREAQKYERWRKINPQLPPLKTSFSHLGRTYTIEGAQGRKQITLTRDDGVSGLMNEEAVVALCKGGR